MAQRMKSDLKILGGLVSSLGRFWRMWKVDKQIRSLKKELERLDRMSVEIESTVWRRPRPWGTRRLLRDYDKRAERYDSLREKLVTNLREISSWDGDDAEQFADVADKLSDPLVPPDQPKLSELLNGDPR